MDYSKVNRSYHPSQVVREYLDRGMMKWQGFYLSEHTSAMKEWREEEGLPLQLQELDLETKFLLLQQSYLNKVKVRLLMKPKKKKKVADKLGTVLELINSKEVLLYTLDQHYERIAVDEIYEIGPAFISE